ncbi:hypothetical protein ACLB1M_30725 [Escherichia coli]
MEQEGYARSSINPFLFPGEGEYSLTFSGWRWSPGLQLIGCDDTISRIPRYPFKIMPQLSVCLVLPSNTSIRLWVCH